MDRQRRRSDRRTSVHLLTIALLFAASACGGTTYSLGRTEGELICTCPQGESCACSSNIVCPEGQACGCAGPACGSPPSGTSNCTVASFQCLGGATAYTCPADPQALDPTLSCTSIPGSSTNGTSTYCCIPWTGSRSTCVPSSQARCDGNQAYGYDCARGSAPTDINSNFSCGERSVLNNGDGLYCCSFH
jgi:hypothetical protein